MRIGVVGYSTRALVEALTELDFQVVAVDAFGDQDTLELAECCRVVTDWPSGILAVAGDISIDYWLLAGGMENHPQVIERLGQLAPVLGPGSKQLRMLRDPAFWEAICKDLESIAWPGCQSACGSPASEWIFKQRGGSGGLHVAPTASPNVDGYWQRYIPGKALGITFMMDDQRVSLVGVTESLLADQWPGPLPFVYRGSVGPIAFDEAERNAVLALAQRIAAQLPCYRGWLQADFIQDPHGKLWLLELNPRWTAGMEVLHECLPLSTSPLVQHLKCFGLAVTEPLESSVRARTLLKAIVYADRDIWLTQATRKKLYGMRSWQILPGLSTELSLADLPALQAEGPVLFSSGSPILTVRLRAR